MIKEKIKSIFFAAAAGLLLCTAPVHASQPRTGSITVESADEKEGGDIREICFSCIKVASYSDGEYELKEEYKGSGVDLNNTDTALELKEAAETLAGYAHTDAVTKKTDNEGTVRFEGLDPGAYLVMAFDEPGRDKIEPSLISVPAPCPDSEDMCFDVTVRPKHSRAREEKEASTPKTAADDSEGYRYLAAAAGAALFCGIISASKFKKKKVLDNRKPYGTIKR